MLRTVGLEVLGSESASGLDKEAAAARTKGRESVREKEEWANSPSITRTRTHTHVLSPICSIVHALYSTLPSHHTHTHTYTHASKNSIQECTSSSSYEQVKIILGFVLLKKRVPREDIGLRRWAHTHARTFTHPLSLSLSLTLSFTHALAQTHLLHTNWSREGHDPRVSNAWWNSRLTHNNFKLKGKKTCSVQKDDPSDAKEVPKIFFATSLRQLPSKGREKIQGQPEKKNYVSMFKKRKCKRWKNLLLFVRVISTRLWREDFKSTNSLLKPLWDPKLVLI